MTKPICFGSLAFQMSDEGDKCRTCRLKSPCRIATIEIESKGKYNEVLEEQESVYRKEVLGV